MTRTSPPQVAFSSGELDPLLHRRFDYQRFQTGLAKCNGFLPLQQGGFTRAPGTLYRGRSKDDARCILVPFEFAANDALVLEFTPNVMRVWRYGVLVMAGAVPYEMATPFGLASLSNLRWVQSADVIYLVDGLQPMQRLSRFALDNWTLTAQPLDRGPFSVQNLDEAKTIQCSAATGVISGWEAEEDVAPGARRRVGNNVYAFAPSPSATSKIGNVQPVHTSGTAIVETVYDEDGITVIRTIGWTFLFATSAEGTVQISATNVNFDASWIGSLLRLEAVDVSSIAVWTSNESLKKGALRRANGRIYELTSGAVGFGGLAIARSVGENMPIHSEGEARADNSPTIWKYISDDVGVVRITAVQSATAATAEVLRTIPLACINAPTYRWSEGAWSARKGYPGTIEIFEQRLTAAATTAEPRTIWFSAVGDFADFAPGVEADDGFAYTIAGAASVNKVLHLRRASTGLHIFALGEEYSTRSDSRAQVIGPTTAVFSSDSEYGASNAQPIAPDGKPIFITRDRRRVIQIAYDFQQDGNVSRVLSLPAQHLGAAFFEQIVWQNAPYRIGWLRRGTGDLVAMIHDPSEEILGWATVSVAGGFVDALAISPAASGTHDILTMAVVRELNGQTVRMIEQQALVFGVLNGAQPISESIHFFAASKFESLIGQSVFTVPQLAGMTDVYAWTDAGQFGPLSVSPVGVVMLPVEVNRAVIGLFDASHVAETLDIQAATQNGNSMGRQKRLASVGIGLHRTAQGQIEVVERDFGRSERVGMRQYIVPNSVGADLTTAFSGVMKLGLPSGHAKEVALRIHPVGGAPLTVTAIIPDIQEAGS